MEQDYTLEINRLELENRIKNLVWTVSGNYKLDYKPNLDAYSKTPDAVLYDGIKQGGLARYFDHMELGSYMVKKVFCGADQGQLMSLAQLAVESAVGRKLEAERPGIRSIRRMACEEVLDQEGAGLSAYPAGRVKAAFLREELEGKELVWTGQLKGPLKILHDLQLGNQPGQIDSSKLESSVQSEASVQTGDPDSSSDLHSAERISTHDIIEAIDRLYNSVVDPKFVKTLEEVEAVTADELSEYSWKDFLKEDADRETLVEYFRQITESMASLSAAQPLNVSTDGNAGPKDQTGERKIIRVSEESLRQVHTFVERSFGKTYLTPIEEKRANTSFCRGIHSDSSLYFTDGILRAGVMRNAQFESAVHQQSKNYRYYEKNFRVVRRNIQILTESLKKSLQLRDEESKVLSDYGAISPRDVWKVGHSSDARIFHREEKSHAMEFCMDILIDASGSQRSRQMDVVLQAYIIMETLSNLEIPFRVMSFCTFWDYTILQRFREYDENRTVNDRIFGFTTSSCNRDGLAIRAVGSTLMQREEENKLMIVLSDGKPHDAMVARKGARQSKPYTGREAVDDTAFEVRRLRQAGISVLGVFAGEESELGAEKLIFGKDFAYIRDISSFSTVVGRYLLKLIED
ncbi:MAG: nitric oxide reductase activation protein [Eubacterium sp.]|nr:nitric oxide reductase activation protein [Eubacterium sp.]